MKTLFKVIAWLCVASVVACGGGEPQEASPEPMALSEPVEVTLNDQGQPSAEVLADQQVLHRGNGEEPQTLDPHLGEGVPTTNIVIDLFEGLTTTAPDGQIVPGAAARWNISRDGLTYTFYLDPNGRWSNGEQVKASDFVWSWRRVVAPETAATYARMLAPVANAEAILAGEMPPSELGVAALNDLTFQVTLASPTPYFLGLLSHPTTFAVYPPAVQAHGSGHVRPGRLVSNGAYQLHDWQVRSKIELIPNPHYRLAEQTHIERVVFYPFEDENTEFTRFRAGDLGWTYQVPSAQFSWLSENMDSALVVSPWFGTYFFSFNLTRPPFADNLALRQALSLAVDRQLLTERVTRFGEMPTFGLVPPGLPDYESPDIDAENMTQAQREALARSLYRQAGYSESQPLTVELRYNTSENHRKIAVAVAAMWKEVLGVKTRLINEEFRVFLQNRAQKRVTEVFRSGWIGDYQDAYTFLELFHSDHGRNDAGYDNPIFDDLLERAANERIDARRRNLMAEAERLLLADQVVLPVFVYVSKRLVHPRLKGWQSNVMDRHPTRFMYWVKAKPREDSGAEVESN